jgi:hypothetical protein
MPLNPQDQRPLIDKAADAYRAVAGGMPLNRLALEASLRLVINEYRADIEHKTRARMQSELDTQGAQLILKKDWDDFCRMLVARATLKDRWRARWRKEHWLNVMRAQIKEIQR